MGLAIPTGPWRSWWPGGPWFFPSQGPFPAWGITPPLDMVRCATSETPPLVRCRPPTVQIITPPWSNWGTSRWPPSHPFGVPSPWSGSCQPVVQRLLDHLLYAGPVSHGGCSGCHGTVGHGAHLSDRHRMAPSPSQWCSGCLPAGGSISRLLEVVRAPYGQQCPGIGALYCPEKMVQGEFFPDLRRHVDMHDPHHTANVVCQFSQWFLGTSFAPDELSFNKLALLVHAKSVF